VTVGTNGRCPGRAAAMRACSGRPCFGPYTAAAVATGHARAVDHRSGAIHPRRTHVPRGLNRQPGSGSLGLEETETTGAFKIGLPHLAQVDISLLTQVLE